MQPGSVRAARERLRAVQAVRTPAASGDKDSKSPKSPKRPWETPTSPNSRQRTYEQDYNYQEPPQDSSWPLPASRYNPPSRAPPPIRKDRNSQATLSPQYPETFYDGASDQMSPQSLQPPMPSFGRNRDSDYSSAPGPNAPRGASWASSNSGSIPDFPLPTSQYQTGRRSQNVPPPKQQQPRRGPSSYYSQFSGPWGVSPIPEESNPRTQTNSYASSNVIPSQMKEFFLEETPSDDDRSTLDFDWAKDGEKIQQPSPGLVRQASLGRRQKPALTTIKNESLRAPTAMPAMPLQVPGSNATRMSHVASILDGESVFLDASSSEHTKERRASEVSYLDPFNPGGPLGRLGSVRNEGKGSIAERRGLGGLAGARAGAKRPPSLDVQAVKEAEARASLTSLPDLIRRATRLAANLDRGKTASRLGMDWMAADGEKPLKHRPSEGSSLGGMLANFPPPATRGQSPSEGNTAEEFFKNLNMGSSRNGTRDSRKSKRQICGMSRRAFMAICVVVLILVAAAVILPVFLIALPNRDKNLSGSSVPVSGALQECQQSTPCSNGGTSVVNLDKSCGCVCSNGFTGSQCGTQSSAGCATIAVAGASASVGTQIPNLVQAAQDQYMIPLDATALSSAFASNNMTCTTENAIVTFPDNAAVRRRSADIPSAVENHFGARTEGTTETAPAGSVPTNIVTASSTGNASPTSTSAAESSPASSTTAESPVATGGSNLPAANASATEFAQIGILFVLQDSRDISAAVSAQENLGQYFQLAARTGASAQASNVTLGNGYFVNLEDYIMTLRNGTRYGVGVNFNGTPSGFDNQKVKRAVTAYQLLKRMLHRIQPS